MTVTAVLLLLLVSVNVDRQYFVLFGLLFDRRVLLFDRQRCCQAHLVGLLIKEHWPDLSQSLVKRVIDRFLARTELVYLRGCQLSN